MSCLILNIHQGITNGGRNCPLENGHLVVSVAVQDSSRQISYFCMEDLDGFYRFFHAEEDLFPSLLIQEKEALPTALSCLFPDGFGLFEGYEEDILAVLRDSPASDSHAVIRFLLALSQKDLTDREILVRNTIGKQASDLALEI